MQAIDCTGTDNQKQGNKTHTHTHPKRKRNNKKDTALANKTIYTLVRYAFYDLRPGNGVGTCSPGAHTGPVCPVRALTFERLD